MDEATKKRDLEWKEELERRDQLWKNELKIKPVGKGIAREMQKW